MGDTLAEYRTGTVVELTNVSRAIFKVPGCLVNVTVAADGAAATVDIYDSETEGDNHLYHIVVADGDTVTVGSDRMVRLNRGLYVKVNAGTTYVSVEYFRLP